MIRFDCAKCRESERMIVKVLLLLTKPYPRDLPVCRSVITTASSMSPKASKYFLSEASFVWYGSPPTKILVKVVSFWSAVGCMTSRAPFIYWWRSIGSAGDQYLARGRLRANRVPASEKPSPVSLCFTRASPTLFYVFFSKLQQPDDIHDSVRVNSRRGCLLLRCWEEPLGSFIVQLPGPRPLPLPANRLTA